MCRRRNLCCGGFLRCDIRHQELHAAYKRCVHDSQLFTLRCTRRHLRLQGCGCVALGLHLLRQVVRPAHGRGMLGGGVAACCGFAAEGLSQLSDGRFQRLALALYSAVC